MKKILSYKKIIFIIVIILVINEWAYRFWQWPVIDMKKSNNTHLEIINEVYKEITIEYKNKYPSNLSSDFVKKTLKDEKKINERNKNGIYIVSSGNSDFILGIHVFSKHLPSEISTGKIQENKYYLSNSEKFLEEYLIKK